MAIVTLTTDFGTQDPFAGIMKGVMLGIAPRVQIVDLTHQIPAFGVMAGALAIAEAWRWFPKKTVHVVVVDPGVGSARRPVMVEAGGHYFVGPDNGVLSLATQQAGGAPRVRHLTNRQYFPGEVSQTFHGRDVFAPVAAQLAAGKVRAAALGPLVKDAAVLALPKAERISTRTWAGEVIHVDRFGNLITNFHRREFPELEHGRISLLAGIHPVDYMVRSYTEAPAGEPVAILGSGGFLEIVLNQDSAAARLRCAAGTPIELSFL
ncbi:MAG: SAM-dependent chlorinase/fluorinase [Bryobacterales bacterium]|nr:SAM-dependent chlorinase/fluorinase [Bryobacterales bacterium]